MRTVLKTTGLLALAAGIGWCLGGIFMICRIVLGMRGNSKWRE